MSLLIHDVPIECINQAATAYHVPATMIIAILKTEGGRNGEASKNKDGSYDYGSMQINSCWLEKIAHHGYTKHDIQYDPCKNVAVGAWILAQSMASGKNVWNGVGNYHSRTKHLNERYHLKVEKYHQWLDQIINKKPETKS